MKNPYLVRLSAYIAHILNESQEDGRIKPSAHALWTRIRAAVAFGCGGAYLEYVVGGRLMGLSALEEDAEEAAERWMETVLNRPLSVHPSRDLHKAHILLEALARRAPDCAGARVVRSDDLLPALTPPPGLARSAARLADLQSVDSHIILRLKDWSCSVPRSLSIWGALSAAPADMAPLDDARWLDLRNLIIAALENAHVRWGRAVACGVSPWDHDLSANQSKTLQAFLGLARANLDLSRLSRASDNSCMRAAWRAAPVSRYASLEAFLDSPLGRDALSICPAPTMTQFDDSRWALGLPAQDANSTAISDVKRILSLLTRSGALSALESRLIFKVAQGDSLQEIAREPWALREFGRPPALNRHVERLSNRLIPAARHLLEGV